MKVSVYIAVSMDGFIARKDGDIEWLHRAGEGSAEPDYGYDAFMATIDTLVMGRNTFEKVLTFGNWPYQNIPVVVLSSAEVSIPRALQGLVESSRLPVPDLEAASALYRDALGAEVGEPQDEPDHGVTVVFINLPNTKIELLYPLGDASPIAGFLAKNPSGGIHHVCYEVEDILAAASRLTESGARVLGDGKPKTGAHGKPVLFLHPKDFNGTLIELEEV